MSAIKYRIITLDQNPSLKEQIDRLSELSWPELLLHGDVRHWHSLFDRFSAYQVAFVKDDDRVIAAGHTVPLLWEGRSEHLPENLDILMHRAVENDEMQIKPNCLSALAIIIDPDFRRENLSRKMIKAMISLGRKYELKSLLAPLRPTLKSSYPEMPFDEYINMKAENSEPFDPWIRVHVRMGAKIIKVMEKSITVVGSVSEWESWTGMKFTESGEYNVKGALQPVLIDLEADRGFYTEPNLWVCHNIV
jgi:hypothetical protein